MTKILIIEDHVDMRYLLEWQVELMGFVALSATSAEDGVKIAIAEKPDLILMDVVMPGTNGYQATRAITHDEATKHIPVIVVTSKNQETDRIWGMRQGAKDYVMKPIDAKELLAKVAGLK